MVQRGVIMVLSINNNANNNIQSMLYNFQNNINDKSFKDIKISDVPNEAGMADVADEYTLKAFACLNLHEALRNTDNNCSNYELLSCIPKILENASKEDLAIYLSKGSGDIVANLDNLNELIKNTGLDKDDECQNFLKEATKNTVEKLIKNMALENNFNEFQSLINVIEKYNFDIKNIESFTSEDINQSDLADWKKEFNNHFNQYKEALKNTNPSDQLKTVDYSKYDEKYGEEYEKALTLKYN